MGILVLFFSGLFLGVAVGVVADYYLTYRYPAVASA